jgi:hypothetical protein
MALKQEFFAVDSLMTTTTDYLALSLFITLLLKTLS